jgi:hypothetical protein
VKNLARNNSRPQPRRADRTFGPAYTPDLDGARLRSKQEKVRVYMLSSSGRFQTLDEIHSALEARFHERFPRPSLSAFLRHLEEKQFGSHVLEKRRRGKFGLWEHRLLPPNPQVITQTELFAGTR